MEVGVFKLEWVREGIGRDEVRREIGSRGVIVRILILILGKIKNYWMILSRVSRRDLICLVGTVGLDCG